jgi:hypothetical protein
MAKYAATEVSPLERRVFLGIVIGDAALSAALVAYLQFFPADRDLASLIWVVVMSAAAVTYWAVRRREIRRREECKTSC